MGVNSDLYRVLVAAFENPNYTPPALPRSGLQAIQLTKDPNINYMQLARTLEADPLLMGQILKRVQSTYYAGKRRITSLEHAIARLGLVTLRELLWEVCFGMRLFYAKNFSPALQRVQIHSVTAAYTTRIIERYANNKDEDSFLTTLLHDSGIAGALLVLAERMPERQSADLEEYWPELSAIHELSGAKMARLWELPLNVQSTIGHHHHFADIDYPSVLEATVCIADFIANRVGKSVVEPTIDPETEQRHYVIDEVDPEMLAASVQCLGLDGMSMDMIWNEAQALFSGTMAR